MFALKTWAFFMFSFHLSFLFFFFWPKIPIYKVFVQNMAPTDAHALLHLISMKNASF